MARRSREKSASARRESSFQREKKAQNKTFSRVAEQYLTRKKEFNDLTDDEQKIVKAEIKSERMKELSDAVAEVLASTKLLEAAASNIKSIRLDSPTRIQELRQIQAEAEKIRTKAKEPKKKIEEALANVRFSPDLKAALKELTDATIDPRKAAEQSYLLAKDKKEKAHKAETTTSPEQQLHDFMGDINAEISSDSKLGKALKSREKIIKANEKLIKGLLKNLDTLTEEDKAKRFDHAEFLLRQLRAVKKGAERSIREKPSELKKKSAFKDTEKAKDPIAAAKDRASLRRIKGLFYSDIPESKYQATKGIHEAEEQAIATSLEQSKERIKAMQRWAFNEETPPTLTKNRIKGLPRPKGYAFDKIATHLSNEQRTSDNRADLEKAGITVKEYVEPVQEEIQQLEKRLKDLQAGGRFTGIAEKRRIKYELKQLRKKAERIKKDQAAIFDRYKRYQRLNWLDKKQTDIDVQSHRETRVETICTQVVEDVETLRTIVLHQNKTKADEARGIPALEVSIYERLTKDLTHDDIATLVEDLEEARLTREEIDDILEIHMNIRMGKTVVDAINDVPHGDLDNYKAAHEAVRTYLLSSPETVTHALEILACKEVKAYLETKLPSPDQEQAVQDVLASYIADDRIVEVVMERLREHSDSITQYSYKIKEAFPKSDLEIEAEGYEGRFGVFMKQFERFKEQLDTTDPTAVNLFKKIEQTLLLMPKDTPPSPAEIESAYNAMVELALHMHALNQQGYKEFLKTFREFFTISEGSIETTFEQFNQTAENNAERDAQTELKELIGKFLINDLLNGLDPLPYELNKIGEQLLKQSSDLFNEKDQKFLLMKQREILALCVEAYELAYVDSWSEEPPTTEAKTSIYNIANLFNLEFHLQHREPIAEVNEQIKVYRKLQRETLPKLEAAKAEIYSTNNSYEQSRFHEIATFIEKLDTPEAIATFEGNPEQQTRIKNLCIELVQLYFEQGKIYKATKRTELQNMISSITETLNLGSDIRDALSEYQSRLRNNESVNHPDAKTTYTNNRQGFLDAFAAFSTSKAYTEFEAASIPDDFENWGPIDVTTDPPKGDSIKKRDLILAAITLFEKSSQTPFIYESTASKNTTGYNELLELGKSLGVEIFLKNHISSAEEGLDIASILEPYGVEIRQIREQAPAAEQIIQNRIDRTIETVLELDQFEAEKILQGLIPTLRDIADAVNLKESTKPNFLQNVENGFIPSLSITIDKTKLTTTEKEVLKQAQETALEAFDAIQIENPTDVQKHIEIINNLFEYQLLLLDSAIKKRETTKDKIISNLLDLILNPTAQTESGDTSLSNLTSEEETLLDQLKDQASQDFADLPTTLSHDDYVEAVDNLRKNLQERFNRLHELSTQKRIEKDTERSSMFKQVLNLIDSPIAQTPTGEQPLSNLVPEEQRKLNQAKAKAKDSLRKIDGSLAQNEFLQATDTVRKDLQKEINEIYARDAVQKEVKAREIAEFLEKKENNEIIISEVLKSQQSLSDKLNKVLNKRIKGKGMKKRRAPFKTMLSEFNALHETQETELIKTLQSPETRKAYGEKAVETFLQVSAVEPGSEKTHPTYPNLVDYLKSLYLNPDDFFGGPSTPPTPPTESGPDNSGGSTENTTKQEGTNSTKETDTKAKRNPGEELARLINEEDEPDYDLVDLSYQGRYENMSQQEKSEFSESLQSALDQIETYTPPKRMPIDEAIAANKKNGSDDDVPPANVGVELERPKRKAKESKNSERPTTLAA